MRATQGILARRSRIKQHISSNPHHEGSAQPQWTKQVTHFAVASTATGASVVRLMATEPNTALSFNIGR
jgi:hypothetical protein